MVVFKEIEKRTNVGMTFYYLAFDPLKIFASIRLNIDNAFSTRIPWPTWGQDVRRVGDGRHDIDLDRDCPMLRVFFPTIGQDAGLYDLFDDKGRLSKVSLARGWYSMTMLTPGFPSACISLAFFTKP